MSEWFTLATAGILSPTAVGDWLETLVGVDDAGDYLDGGDSTPSSLTGLDAMGGRTSYFTMEINLTVKGITPA